MAVNLSHVYASITSPYQKNPFSYGDYKLSLSSYVVEFTTATGAHERRNDANVGFSRSDEREIPRLRRYARALTRSADRADDLVQETLLRAVAKAHLWHAGTDLRAWLFTIMHNQYVNIVRRAIREKATIDIDQISSSLIATTDPTGSRQLRELERSLGFLPDEQREVILLVGLEGMSYDSAAQILNVPVGTVRSRLSRGRDALRRLMGFWERAVAVATARAPTTLAA